MFKNTPKITILGAGWLGNILENYLPNASLCRHKDEAHDICNIKELGGDIVINTAAITDIDFCEKNKEECFRSNVTGAVHLAKLCREKGKKYVFFSSACIFSCYGEINMAYEDTIPNPQCFYSLTKWMAEELILAVNPKSLIVRIRLPLSEVPHPRNTITKILSYKKLNTNKESVTVVEDMLPMLKDLIDADSLGVFHIINKGYISPAEIGKIFGHTFETWTKEEQDKELARQGRAKRVSAFIGTKRIPYLPDIQERILTLKEKYVLAQGAK